MTEQIEKLELTDNETVVLIIIGTHARALDDTLSTVEIKDKLVGFGVENISTLTVYGIVHSLMGKELAFFTDNDDPVSEEKGFARRIKLTASGFELAQQEVIKFLESKKAETEEAVGAEEVRTVVGELVN